MRCPICEKTFAAPESTALPFCSERCRTIDLGRWLGETYGIPIEPDAESLEAPTDDLSDSGGDAPRRP
jgi:uncharacterized protein